jgi:hypothetical protein
MSVRPIMLVALLVAVLGCGNTDSEPQWADAADFDWLPVLDPVSVAEGEGWRFDMGLEPYETGEPSAPCLQLVIGDEPLGCIGVDAENRSFGAVTRVDEQRVIWRASTIDDLSPVDHFVVWSNASPSGRRLDPINHSNVENLLWIMEPGEAPWGYQTIAPDGTLLAQTSLVGLPAD